MAIPVYVVIVTHNSAEELDICLAHLEKQTVPIKGVAIVDSGSTDPNFLDDISPLPGMKIIKTENVGFSRANNIGFKQIVEDREGMVVFLNPDTFLPPDYLAQAVNVLNENPAAAVVSGKLLGFDLKEQKPSGKIDSTGIFRRWYGRWYDRGQGQKDLGQYDLISAPLALCGALMCCRLKALVPFRGDVFDPDFFLYKEDIELCIRLRAAGWTLVYDPKLIAHHCRGWARKRQKVSYDLRLMAARNEVLLYRKHPGPAMVWALLKLFLVQVFRL
ncbi:MAG: glycosyltransferase family 2 protein [Proteobacteria bacterium]|nr:glycosyltransferase family 2 protein [Pseudomonadota bacterium]